MIYYLKKLMIKYKIFIQIRNNNNSYKIVLNQLNKIVMKKFKFVSIISLIHK